MSDLSDQQPTLTLDDSSRASPGKLKINPIRWIRHYPTWPLIWLVSFLVCAAMTSGVHWSFCVPAIAFLAVNLYYWRRVRDHFWHGTANTAIVVAVDPVLIAVSTDLTLSHIRSYPTIKIIKIRPRSICGKVPKLGTQLATVSMYIQDLEQNRPHWLDFDPRPIDCVTSDVDIVRAVMDTLPGEEWRELRRWLRKVPRPYQCGLFLIGSDGTSTLS